MKIKLKIWLNAQKNAEEYFNKSKEISKKQEGAKKAIENTLVELEKAKSQKIQEGEKPKIKRKKEWYEKYHWFFTSEGKLVLAGKDAKQNDILVNKIMKSEDLFFHADIQGAPATILIEGRKASENEKKEAAYFAAAYSSAWKKGITNIDVYCVLKEQLLKHLSGAYVGQGAFVISGKREWFNSIPLGLALIKENDRLETFPLIHKKEKEAAVIIFPGEKEKGDAAKEIAKLLDLDVEEILLRLPKGKFHVKGKHA
jgi:predicted ribosome quality control (RQC) complex YloA/Tae2 family protein